MLIGIVGAPITGKTTLAAGLFARLKEMGVACEFVPEHARKYIAKMRRWEGDGMVLGDSDQQRIAFGQAQDEDLLVGSGTQVVVTDGSTLNALFYRMDLEPAERDRLLLAGSGRYDVLFFPRSFACPYVMPWDPVGGKAGASRPDPNRVHDAQFSEALDELMDGVLYVFRSAERTGAPVPEIHELRGTPEQRLTEALRVVTLRLEVVQKWSPAK